MKTDVRMIEIAIEDIKIGDITNSFFGQRIEVKEIEETPTKIVLKGIIHEYFNKTYPKGFEVTVEGIRGSKGEIILY